MIVAGPLLIEYHNGDVLFEDLNGVWKRCVYGLKGMVSPFTINKHQLGKESEFS